MKLRTKTSRISVLILALLMCFTAVVMPKLAQAADSPDKTELIKPTLKGTVSQNGHAVTDTIDPAQPFDVEVTFEFPIINNDMIGTTAANGITKKSQQVDDGDYADFPLGENFKAVDATGNAIPVYIKAPGSPDDRKQVGTIKLTQDGAGPVTARMTFHDPDEKFDFESDGRKDLTVHFTGHFKASEQSSQTPGSGDRFVKVLDQTFPLPSVEEKIEYAFSKAGALDDQSTKESITWTSTVKKTSNLGETSLGGETFIDDLTKVGEYIPGSFKVNGKAVAGADVYDQTAKKISYTFPADFAKATATITFQTKVTNPVTTQSVTNEAKLQIPNADEKQGKTTVVVHKPLEIKKNLKEIDVNKATGEREVIWTIVAGAPYENFGPAWVGDILSGSLENQAAPKRVDLTFEQSVSGAEGSWTKITDVQIPADPATFPAFPEGDNKTCPTLSQYSGAIYDLGAGWHKPTKAAQPNDEYKPLQNHWFFIKELNGQYRITVKLVFDAGTEIGPLKNDAEIHTCTAGVVYPVTPPVYSGVATIVKRAEKNYDPAVLNQGLLPWSVTVDFSNVFPSDERFVYECFYYGSDKAFASDKEGLNTQGALGDDVLAKLIAGEKGETFFNFDQAYAKGSLENTGEKAKPGEAPVKLTDTVIPVYNAANKQVGEIVKISGFSSIKKYTFSLKTVAQNIIATLLEKSKGSYDLKYQNTAVLAVGKGDTLKMLSAVDIYELPGNLFNKFAMEFDANLDSMDDVSKNDFTSGYRDFITSIPQVDSSKSFNHKDRTILFRIDVNPQGLNFADYIAKLGGDKPEGDFTKLTITDALPEGLTLQPVVDGGPDYYLYQAEPGTAAFIDYSITFPGSAKFSSYMPQGKAVKKVAPQDAHVSFDKANLTWSFDQYDGTPYFIVMRAKVSEEQFAELMKNTPQGEPITFKNNVQLSAGGQKLVEASGSADVSSFMLSKAKPEVAGERLNWSFDYKPFDIGLDDVVIKDALDKNIGIPIDEKGNPQLDNFKITRSNALSPSGAYEDYADVAVVTGTPKDGEVALKYNLSEHALYFTLPNAPEDEAPYAYRFEYSTILKPVDLDAEVISNHIEMSAKNEKPGASGHSEMKTQEYAAFATIKDYPYAVIKKVDESGNPLAGAVFQYTDSAGETVAYLSGENGVLYVIKLAGGITEVKETKAPDGYLKLTDPIKLELTDNGVAVASAPAGAEGAGSFSDPLIVKNVKVGKRDIPVAKLWEGDEPQDRPDSITVTLVVNGEPTDTTLVLSEENGWKGTFKDLPVIDEDGNPIVYTVAETAVEGYESTIAGDQETGFTITNVKPGKPHEPGTPEPGNPEPGKTPQPSKTHSPSTGDNGGLYGLAGLALLSGLGVLLARRKEADGRE